MKKRDEIRPEVNLKDHGSVIDADVETVSPEAWNKLNPRRHRELVDAIRHAGTEANHSLHNVEFDIDLGS